MLRAPGAGVRQNGGLEGRIAPGLLADFVVVDRDPFAVPAAEPRELAVVWTIVGGPTVHPGG